MNKPIYHVYCKNHKPISVICLCFNRGLARSNEEAFRHYFARVGDLRALFPSAPVLCLTATASKLTQFKVKELMLLKNPVIHSESADRPNIRFCIRRVPEGPDAIMWLAKLLKKCKEDKESIPRTIIYCRRIQDCSELYLYLEKEVGVNSSVLEERLFDMIHSKTPGHIQTSILESLSNNDSPLRCLISTKVTGMGMDIQCSNVVHYGPPSSIDDYVQQIGRAGRNGEQAHAIMTFHGRQASVCDPAMFKILNNCNPKKLTKTCYRELFLSEFGGTSGKRSGEKHTCCDVCAGVCECDNCSDTISGFDKYSEDLLEDSEELTITVRHPTSEEMVKLKVDLFLLKDRLDRCSMMIQSTYMKPEIIHGLSEAVIKNILDNVHTICSIDDLSGCCGLSNERTALEVAEIMSNIFNDFDTMEILLQCDQ